MSAELEDRKRTRCKPCGLVQFVSLKGQCVRCHKPYHEPEPVPVVKVARPTLELDGPPVEGKAFDFEFWTAFVLWDTRESLGLSQRKLSKRMNVVRTYVSKIERAQATPSINSFRKFCSALETSPAFMVRKIEFLVTGH